MANPSNKTKAKLHILNKKFWKDSLVLSFQLPKVILEFPIFSTKKSVSQKPWSNLLSLDFIIIEIGILLENKSWIFTDLSLSQFSFDKKNFDMPIWMTAINIKFCSIHRFLHWHGFFQKSRIFLGMHQFWTRCWSRGHLKEIIQKTILANFDVLQIKNLLVSLPMFVLVLDLPNRKCLAYWFMQL